ncbi:MAG: hypothetical protein RQ752_03085 [Thermohalobaculum sp.]|nr:hypothetical protein [Thermohalobaculum sp.]
MNDTNAGAAILHALHDDLAARGARLRIVGPHGAVRELLRADGLADKVGGPTAASPSPTSWQPPIRRHDRMARHRAGASLAQRGGAARWRGGREHRK